MVSIESLVVALVISTRLDVVEEGLIERQLGSRVELVVDSSQTVGCVPFGLSVFGSLPTFGE